MKNVLLAIATFASLNLYALDITKSKVIEIKVTEKGFQPSTVEVLSGEAITLQITRITDKTCATEIIIKDRNINQKLPLNETVSIDLGKIKKGTLNFSCGMNMDKGKIISK